MLTTEKKTLVLGASDHPGRYSYLAVNKLRGNGHPVVAIGRKAATVGDVEIGTDKQQLTDIDTVTLYLNPAHQKEYYDYILSLHPRRIIFNPGAEIRNWPHWRGQTGLNPLKGVRWSCWVRVSISVWPPSSGHGNNYAILSIKGFSVNSKNPSLCYGENLMVILSNFPLPKPLKMQSGENRKKVIG